MTRGLRIAGVQLLLMGATWFLQGIGVLPGSFMSGQPQWALYGAIAAALGAGLLLMAQQQVRPRKGGGA